MLNAYILVNKMWFIIHAMRSKYHSSFPNTIKILVHSILWCSCQVFCGSLLFPAYSRYLTSNLSFHKNNMRAIIEYIIESGQDEITLIVKIYWRLTLMCFAESFRDIKVLILNCFIVRQVTENQLNWYNCRESFADIWQYWYMTHLTNY